MIKVGELGTEPLLESIATLIENWDDEKLIDVDGHMIEIDLITGEGTINIVLYDSDDRVGNE